MSMFMRVMTLRAEEEDKSVEVAQASEPAKPMRPGQCRAHLRKTLAAAFPAIVTGFVERAKAGDCQHLKLATALLEVPAHKRRQNEERRIIQGWVKAIEDCD